VAANEIELAKLIVRLIGDNTKYIQMLEETKGKTAQAVKEVQSESSKMAQRGAAIAQEVAAPHEKLKTKLLELGVLLKKGAIDQETYNRAVRQTKDQLNGKNDIVGLLQGSMTSYALRMIGFGAAMRQVSQIAKQVIGDLFGVEKAMFHLGLAMAEVGRISGRLSGLKDSASGFQLDRFQGFSPEDKLKENELELKKAEKRVKEAQRSANEVKAEMDALFARRKKEVDATGRVSRLLYGDPIGDEIKNAHGAATSETNAAMARVEQLKQSIKKLKDELTVFATKQAPTLMSRAFSGGLKDSIEAWKNEQKEVKEIIEQSRSPIEVFNDEIDRLSYYLGRGAISMEVFEKASARANMALEKTEEKTKAAHMAMQAFDQASFRSAEARTRIEQHLTRNDLDRGSRTVTVQGLPPGAERAQEITLLNRIANGVEKQARVRPVVITPSGSE
jgi:hypothetical protein